MVSVKRLLHILFCENVVDVGTELPHSAYLFVLNFFGMFFQFILN